ncbi:MAG: helix-turn-helix transcriptional regulator [Bacteroidetes bacterium]|nr:helix-turn-helix transcriptional regulator [Bacteroidota bacterium]
MKANEHHIGILKNLRLKNQLTQSELASKLHMSQNSYSLLESGKTQLINSAKINLLGKTLNIDPYELILKIFPGGRNNRG